MFLTNVQERAAMTVHEWLRVLACTCACSWLVPAWAAGAAWQDIPEIIVLQKMGDEMVVNGIPMSVRAFNTNLAVDEVLQMVQSAWERNRNRTSVTRTSIPPWTILNQGLGKEHRSFQIRPSRQGGFEGFVALTLPASAREAKSAIRLPAGITALQIIDSIDSGRSSQQIIAVSDRSIEATAAALEGSLKASGWQRHVMKKNAGTVVFAANRNGQEFDAILTTEKRGALVMMNTADAIKK